jgi:hypothetical protein
MFRLYRGDGSRKSLFTSLWGCRYITTSPNPGRIWLSFSMRPVRPTSATWSPGSRAPSATKPSDSSKTATLISLSFGTGLIVATKALVDVEVPRKMRWLLLSLQLAAEQRSSGPVQPRINRSAVTRVAPRDRAAATMKRSAGSAWNSSNWAADRARAPSRGISLSPAANHSRRQLSGV